MNIIHNTFSSVNEVSLNRTCFRLSWRWWTQCSSSSQSSLGIFSDRLFSGFGFINNIAMHCFMSGRHIGDTSQMVLHAQYSLVIHGCTATYYNDLRWVGRGMWRGDVIWHRETFQVITTISTQFWNTACLEQPLQGWCQQKHKLCNTKQKRMVTQNDQIAVLAFFQSPG